MSTGYYKSESGLTTLANKPQPSLVLTSLDIGRVLADRNGVNFRAQGLCMYPAIFPGDILKIQSRPVADINIGEIVVCRRQGSLFGHRVIEKGIVDGKACIITRPDRSEQGNDGPTYDDNLLGVVVAISRNGKPAPLSVQNNPFLIRVYQAILLWFFESIQKIRLSMDGWLAGMDSNKMLQIISRAWFFFARPQMTFMARVPVNAALDGAVYRPIALEEFKTEMEWNGRKIRQWTLVLNLNKSPQPAAFITLTRNPDGVWAVTNSYTRKRYQGIGFEKVLKQKAEETLKSHS